ncbi:MAG: T9SS type A sorting domain-containing protein, partial [Bacteroidia bacterium]|nr:T9SS type A sorting domain-containing protein [Bacteroidia bacterium]
NHTFYGDFDNDGTFTGSGNILFSPGAPFSSSASISLLGSSFSSIGQVEFGGNVPITLTGGAATFEELVISNSHASGITAPSSWTINNDLLISSGSIFNTGSATTHTIAENLINNGTLNGQTSLIEFTGDTVSVDGVGENRFEDVKVSASTLLALNNDIQVYSDLIVDGLLDTSGSTIEFLGTGASTISGTADSIVMNELKTSKTGGAQTTLSIPVIITGNLEMNSGNFLTDATNLLIINDNATASSGSDTSFVVGPMKKIGNDTFDFPLGDSIVWARLGISAPSSVTDEFTAQYHFQGFTDTLTMATSPTPVLNNVSSMEYWTCDRTVGSSNVKVELYWQNRFLSGVDSVNADLVVARWNGTAWENAGQSIAQGDFMGSVTSNTVTSFSPFTLGSLNYGFNYLPVEFLSFEAELNDNKTVDLRWETASEINNDFFIIERSIDGIDFDEIERVDGAGTSTKALSYKIVDYNPVLGINYYRIKQIDFDGNSSYSNIEFVQVTNSLNEVLIYPNPANDVLNIELNAKNGNILVYSQLGILLESRVIKNGVTSLDISNYSSGVHVVVISVDGKNQVYRFSKI